MVQAVHYSIDWQKWGSKRLRYWSALQSNVEMSATTSEGFRPFLDRIATAMSIDSLAADGRSARLLKGVGDAIQGDPDLERELMRVLAEEAQYPVVVVRVRREEAQHE